MATKTIVVGDSYKGDNGIRVRVLALDPDNLTVTYEIEHPRALGAVPSELSFDAFSRTFTEVPATRDARVSVGDAEWMAGVLQAARSAGKVVGAAFALLLMFTAVAGAQTDLYGQHQLTSMCGFNPYGPTPVTYEVRPVLFDTYTVRYSIAQGSVGMPGSELAYLNLSNLETNDHTVAIRIVFAGKPCAYKWEGVIPAGGRVSIGLHADPNLSVVGPDGRPTIGRWNFSAVVYFAQAGGDVDLTNYSAQNVEVSTKPGKPIARTPQ